MAFRSATAIDVPRLTTVIGAAVATDAAPLAVWPVAGSSQSRGALLRGHTLYDDGVIVTPALGRRLAYGSAEYEYPLYARSGGTLGLAGFADVARAWRRLDGSSSDLHVDVGVGVRLNPRGGGPIRLDVGWGLDDHRRKISAGYVAEWGEP
jgi:hypothetical protein